MPTYPHFPLKNPPFFRIVIHNYIHGGDGTAKAAALVQSKMFGRGSDSW